MVTALGLFQTVQIILELGLGVKTRAVNALQLRIAFLALPVGAGDAHQFEGLNLTGGWDMRAAAEIDEFAGGVKRDHRIGGFFLDELALKYLI